MLCSQSLSHILSIAADLYKTTVLWEKNKTNLEWFIHCWYCIGRKEKFSPKCHFLKKTTTKKKTWGTNPLEVQYSVFIYSKCHLLLNIIYTNLFDQSPSKLSHYNKVSIYGSTIKPWSHLSYFSQGYYFFLIMHIPKLINHHSMYRGRLGHLSLKKNGEKNNHVYTEHCTSSLRVGTQF